MNEWELKRQDCWDYLGHINNRGYGSYHRGNGEMIGVHRFMYELFVGEIPEGLEIDHLCRNRACVNPNHLEPVTSKENTLRGKAPSAINKQKTHCKYGHEFTPENTFLTKDGRYCLTCRKAYDKARDWKTIERIRKELDGK